MLPLKLFQRVPIATGLVLIPLAVVADEVQTVAAAKTAAEKMSTVLSLPTQQQRAIGKTWLTAQRQPRVALVIGNAAYQEDALTNPVNDAADIAKALRELGFEVTLLQNKDLKAMDEAIENFSRQLRQGGVGVFYYAGHGVQVEGENYLIPLSARLNRQQDVRYEAVPLGKVLNAMEEAETQVNIVIIDACRDNPFYRRWRSSRRGSGSIRGLAQVELPPQGTVIAFATAPGDFAEDDKGRNSPFTSHLLQHIKTPNQDVVLMFRQVRAEVLRDTKNEQEPWYQESLVGSFSFNSTDKLLSPLMVVTKNEQGKEERVTGVFISQQDAQKFFQQLQKDKPDVASKVKVRPVSLGEVYKLAAANANKPDALGFAYVPIERQVDSAKKILGESGEQYQGGVPLFVARGGKEQGYLTVQQNNEQIIPFFFEKQQLEAMVERFKKEKPDLASTFKIEVIPLESLIATVEQSNDEMLDKIRLIPSEETREFMQTLQRR